MSKYTAILSIAIILSVLCPVAGAIQEPGPDEGTVEPHKFYIRDSQGNNLGWFDSIGNLFVFGDITTESSVAQLQSTTRPEFIIQDAAGNIVLRLNDLGEMFIFGTIHTLQTHLSPPEGAFIINDATGNVVSFVDANGMIFLKGRDFQAKTAHDVNGDGTVNILDLQVVVNAVLEIPVSPFTHSDVNRDDAVNLFDVFAMVAAILNPAQE